MAPFEYLIAFVSVVLGLAITHPLSSLLKIVERRDTARWDWIPIVWTYSLLVWTVLFWWFTYNRAGLGADEIHVLHLFYVLGYTGAIFMCLGLLYPHSVGSEHDMRAHFEKNRPLFFSALLILAAFDLGDTAWSFLTSGGVPFWGYWVTVLIWGAGSFAALTFDDRRFHALYAVVFAIAVTALTIVDPSLDGVRTLG